MFDDINKIAATLDEHINKALAKRPNKLERYEDEISKGLSHNPFEPVLMTDDSPFHNPYRQMGDGAFLPYSAEHWESQGRNADDYLTNKQFYDTYVNVGRGIGRFNTFAKSIDNMFKADGSRGAPIGTISTHSDGEKYRKVSDKLWQPVGKPHMGKWLDHSNPEYRRQANDAIENHSSKVGELEKQIQRKQGAKKTHEEDMDEMHNTTMAKMKAAMMSQYAGRGGMPPAISKHFEDHDKKMAERVKERAAKAKSGMKDVESGLKESNAQKHHVSVKILHNGEKYDHEFKDVQASGGHHAIEKVRDLVGKRLPGSQVLSISAKNAKAASKDAESAAVGKLAAKGIVEPKDSLGITRENMPQISSEHFPEFLKFLKSKNISFTAGDVKVDGLKPAQAQINAKAAAGLTEAQAKKTIIVSSDGYVIDGHHRWYHKKLGKAKFISAVTINMKAKELLASMEQFGKVGKVGMDGKATETDKVHKKDGKYHPERAKMHETILKSIVDKVKVPPSGTRPVAVFTAGGPGSGKSSMVRAAHSQFGTEMAQIAADEVKKEIPEYSAELARGNEDAAIVVHEESTDIAAEAIERCIDAGKPFMLDSTFKNVPKFKAMIAKLKAKGYDIHVLYAHCSADEAVKRSKKRQVDTGRKVDENVVRDGNDQAKKALYELGGLADSTAVFDTTADGAPPPSLMFHHDKTKDKDEDFGRVKDLVKGGGSQPLYDRFLDQIKVGKYEIEHDDDDSEIPLGDRLQYDKKQSKGKK